MPSRERRAGARAGHLSPELRTAIKEEAGRLAKLDAPVEIVRAVGDAFAALDQELGVLADLRLRAMRELRREGWSYDRIATATGLSKGRVAQLIKSQGPVR